jgi:hypothetical protein
MTRKLVVILLCISLAQLLGFTGTAAAQIDVSDTGPLPRHTVENEHLAGLLDHSNFQLVGRSNPQGPYPLAARNWTDLYGYAYDGKDPQFEGRRYGYVTTGGFRRRGGFLSDHFGGVAAFDVTSTGDPEYYGTFHPDCALPTCSFLIRDAEIYDGVGFFSSNRAVEENGGVFVFDLRSNPTAPVQINHLNQLNHGGLTDIHEIGLDVVGPGEAYLYVIDSQTDGRVSVYDVSNARSEITKVADINGVSTHGAFAQNGVLYVAGDDRVTMYDVSDVGAGNVNELGSFLTPGGFTHSAWSDSYVNKAGESRDVIYLTHEENGTDLQVWDVTGMTQPNSQLPVEMIASISNEHLAATQGTGDITNLHNVFLVGDILFTSWTVGGMVVFNVADPANPLVIDTFDTNPVETDSNFAGAFGVNAAIGMDRVLISDRATGLWVVDVANLVPEPSSLALLTPLILTLFAYRRKK